MYIRKIFKYICFTKLNTLYFETEGVDDNSWCLSRHLILVTKPIEQVIFVCWKLSWSALFSSKRHIICFDYGRERREDEKTRIDKNWRTDNGSWAICSRRSRPYVIRAHLRPELSPTSGFLPNRIISHGGVGHGVLFPSCGTVLCILWAVAVLAEWLFESQPAVSLMKETTLVRVVSNLNRHLSIYKHSLRLEI
jgi:hypothetical protein